MKEKIFKSDIFPIFLLIISIYVLFITAPKKGTFWWSDSPRHALNGVFVKDFLADVPLSDPQAYTYHYYGKYPALTILLYPPLFYFLSAPFYALLGISHTVGLFVVSLHYAALAWGMYILARFWLPRFPSFAASLLLIGSPEIALWGRQVMLEVPAYAFVIWSAVTFNSYRKKGGIWHLYLSAALIVLAMYTKMSSCFLVPLFVLILLIERRHNLFQDKHTYIILGLSLIGLLPLLYITINFGQANVQSVAGIADSQVSRLTINGWIWYLEKLPNQIGWIPTILSAVFVFIFTLKTQFQLSRNDIVFWIGWFVIGYLFFSTIDLKEARHSIFILAPISFVSHFTINQILSKKASSIISIIVAIGTFGYTLAECSVPYVEGYAEAAEIVARHAPENSVVLFSGYRDGSFIFNMRTREDRRDLSVLRADKLLLSLAVRRELGVEQMHYTEEEIVTLINQHGVHLVVAQSDFWIDFDQMARLQRVLHSNQFEEIARIPTRANFNAQDKELVIYRNLGNVAQEPVNLKMNLPIIRRSIEVKIGTELNKNIGSSKEIVEDGKLNGFF